MPKIENSSFLGEFEGVPVYAETCSEKDLKGLRFMARLVECPADGFDKVVRVVDGLETIEGAEAALQQLSAMYRRSH